MANTSFYSNKPYVESENVFVFFVRDFTNVVGRSRRQVSNRVELYICIKFDSTLAHRLLVHLMRIAPQLPPFAFMVMSVSSFTSQTLRMLLF
jgi:hypothetical protein